MTRKLLYLINPISGTGNKGTLKEIITARTKSVGMAFEIYPTVASGDYSFLFPVIREQGFTDVVVAGGDGTINCAVQALKDLDVQFGIIPCGSGNGLAFSASLPKDPLKALDIIFAGRSQPTDAFYINNRFACMLCGLGLDAQVAHDFANDPRRGLTTYVRKTVANFLTARSYPFLIEAAGRRIGIEAYFISIANSNQFGNHFTIAPRASLNDGLLDIVVMARQNKLRVLLQALKQVSGYNRLQQIEVISEKKTLLYFQTDALRILNEAGAPMHIDGDPVETEEELNIRIERNCFQMLVGS